MNYQKRPGNITASQTVLVVGVVAIALFALVMIPFYNNYQQKLSIVKYRKTHASLIQANRMYALSSSDDTNNFDTTMPVDNFANTYFTPYLQISEICKVKDSSCWNKPQYKDLRKNKIFDKPMYSLVMEDGPVLGFYKNKDGLMSIIIDTNGKSGANKLGKDIFVFYFYNNATPPAICDKDVYATKEIPNGLHLGGYDKCGIPHDTYSQEDLISAGLFESCSKKAQTDNFGLGAGAACGALIYRNGWNAGNKYPK